MPIIDWLPHYKKSWLTPDLLAGLSVWALVIPQALAYAEVVGVPPQYGLYTILGASVLYAVFASTRQVVTGPSASVAAVTAPVAALYVASTAPDYLSTVIALTLCVGVVYVLLGVFRMGWVSNFLAKAVLEGFIFAVGFGLIVDQLPKILGIPKAEGSYWDVLVGVVKDLDLTNSATLAVGAAAVGLLLLMRFKAPKLPRAFIVVILGILAVSWLDLTTHGVEVVGKVPTGLPSLALPTGFSVVRVALDGGGRARDHPRQLQRVDRHRHGDRGETPAGIRPGPGAHRAGRGLGRFSPGGRLPRMRQPEQDGRQPRVPARRPSSPA